MFLTQRHVCISQTRETIRKTYSAYFFLDLWVGHKLPVSWTPSSACGKDWCLKFNSDSQQHCTRSFSYFLSCLSCCTGSSFISCLFALVVSCVYLFLFFLKNVSCKAAFILHLNLKISTGFWPKPRKLLLWPLKVVCCLCGEAVWRSRVSCVSSASEKDI